MTVSVLQLTDLTDTAAVTRTFQCLRGCYSEVIDKVRKRVGIGDKKQYVHVHLGGCTATSLWDAKLPVRLSATWHTVPQLSL